MKTWMSHEGIHPSLDSQMMTPSHPEKMKSTQCLVDKGLLVGFCIILLIYTYMPSDSYLLLITIVSNPKIFFLAFYDQLLMFLQSIIIIIPFSQPHAPSIKALPLPRERTVGAVASSGHRHRIPCRCRTGCHSLTLTLTTTRHCLARVHYLLPSHSLNSLTFIHKSHPHFHSFLHSRQTRDDYPLELCAASLFGRTRLAWSGSAGGIDVFLPRTIPNKYVDKVHLNSLLHRISAAQSSQKVRGYQTTHLGVKAQSQSYVMDLTDAQLICMDDRPSDRSTLRLEYSLSSGSPPRN